MSDIQTILTRQQVLDIIPYSATQIWRMEKAGEFPKPIRLGANRVGYLSTAIEAWLASKLMERDNA